MIEIQEVANFIREVFRQVLRLAACTQGFTDTQHCLVALASVFTGNDRVRAHPKTWRKSGSDPRAEYFSIDDSIVPKVALFCHENPPWQTETFALIFSVRWNLYWVSETKTDGLCLIPS